MRIKQGEYKTEEWLPVVGFQGYMVSSLGRVKSWDTGHFVEPWKSRNGKILFIRLKTPGGTNVTKKVSRVVADAFLYNPIGYAEIRHRDGDGTNCRVSNLMYIGDEETDLNNKARARRGKPPTAFKGEKVSKSKYVGLTDEDTQAVAKQRRSVRTVTGIVVPLNTPKVKKEKPKPEPKQRKRYGSVRVKQTGQVFPSVAEMARQLDLDPSTVSAMLSGKRQSLHHGMSFEYESPRMNLPPEEKKKRRVQRPVRHIQTGHVYESQSEAAKDLDLVQSHISAQLRGLHKHVKGQTFEYADV